MLQAREYQDAAVGSLYEYFGTKDGNPLIAMPTGTGKSVVIAMFLMSIFRSFPGQKVLIATHVKELIAQNYAKLLEVWPDAPAGINSAGLNRKDFLDPIVFCGIASVAKKADWFGRVDLLIIDEAHLVSPNDETMYRSFIAALKKVNPLLKVIGLTATPWRLGQGKIIEDGIFTDVCFDMTNMLAFNWLIDQGYLSTLIPKKTTALLDTTGVHMRGGEFIANELQHAVDKPHITEAAVREMLELGHDRHSWLIFAAGVDHAIHISELMNMLGVPTAAVHSKMPDKDRDRAIDAFKAGQLRAVVNNNVLTTGFDHPGIDMIGVLRPTASTVLWVQMLGRGTRPVYADGYDVSSAEGRQAAILAGPKRNCLVLDFAGNTKKLGPINDPVIPRKKGDAKGDAPVRLCEACGVWNHASARACCYCGEPFPPPTLKIKAHASTDQLIKVDNPIVEVFEVTHITYSIHTKVGRPPMLRVSYYCGLRKFDEFVCFEHDGYAGRKARLWWAERSPGALPATTLEAVERTGEIACATHLEVWVNKKYPELMRHCFDGSAFGSKPPAPATVQTDVHYAGNPQLTKDLDDDIPF